jgi:hypothetical protein
LLEINLKRDPPASTADEYWASKPNLFFLVVKESFCGLSGVENIEDPWIREASL